MGKIFARSALVATVLAAATATTGSAQGSQDVTDEESITARTENYETDVQAALRAAGSNAPELERALDHYKDDPQKLEAMLFIVGDTHRRLTQRFPSNEWNSDLAQGGAQETIDATTISAGFLIDNVELAFQARERFSWTQELYGSDRDRFFSQVLPYRFGTGELSTLDDQGTHWRALLLDGETFSRFREKHGLSITFEDISRKLGDLNTRYETAEDPSQRARILHEAIQYVDVELFENEGCRYFPRGPQELTLETFLTKGEGEDEGRRGGRCTDSDNALRYALTAVGIPTTATRFIAWPHGDDNHQVLTFYLGGERHDLSAMVCRHRTLDAFFDQGPYVPAKAYEEQWGNWEATSNIAINLKPGEELPWYIGFYLRTRSMIDVTDRYGPVSDLEFKDLSPSSLVYLGVVNNNWDVEELGTATVAVERTNEDGSVTFENVGHGRDTLYFPYHYGRDNLSGELEATLFDHPLILTKEGTRMPLYDESGEDGQVVSIVRNSQLVRANSNYALLTFQSGDSTSGGALLQAGWREKDIIGVGPDETAYLPGIEEGVLYILKDTKDGRFSRPFTYSESGEISVH